MNKEEIYDSQVFPLMQQIIQICKDSGIAMLADFAIPTEEDEGLRCTSIIPDETGNNEQLQLNAYEHIRRGGSSAPAMMTTTHGDGRATMTAFI